MRPKTHKFAITINKFGGMSFRSQARTANQRREENRKMAETIKAAVEALGTVLEDKTEVDQFGFRQTEFTMRIPQ